MRTALVLFASVLSACANQSTSGPDAMRFVTYSNQTIPLSRTYEDFHAYRDDPNNLPPGEIPRVAQLVRTAPLPETFASRKDADDAFLKLMFPGYGLSMLQLREPVALYAVEIPHMQENRWVALVEQNGVWVVVDDFLWPDSKGIVVQAKYIEGKLVYFGRDGRILRER